MGQTYSKYMSERKEKARFKRRLIKRLDEAGELLERLQERYESVKNEVSELNVEISSVEIDEEKKASERKMSFREMMLDYNNRTWDDLQIKNLRNFENRKIEVHRTNSKEYERLAVLKWLKQKLEGQLKADQLSMFNKKQSLDTWTVRSLPDLHVTEFPL